jgi:hypothetical protein
LQAKVRAMLASTVVVTILPMIPSRVYFVVEVED